MCKELGTLPRDGGLLEQPAHEIALLDKVFEAMSKHEQRLQEREDNRRKNREKHKSGT